ncbi:hypothetical protein BDV26DRAFT_199047 [Aspergillus bertholletiae]|uniref:Ferritin-like domain-containing protein n=1 Tax=Aspergillus bertholletiae TaxID=1226010 RepID=A0A5N7B8E6_9EURO|nr:hypothetical protein BDV26DRAFT_199047 [Aspergillus bertholletiae]
MYFHLLPLALTILPTVSLPTTDKASAVPGESTLFTTYQGKQTPLASNYTRAILPTTPGPRQGDDLLFQNLLAAEWAIYSFYQQGVEAFTADNFTALGLPNTTYERIVEIRDNEAGHVRIFQDEISSSSVKPGPCKYDYGFAGSAQYYLALQVFLEVSSMAFLTGLVRQAEANDSKSALMAIGQVESRHNAWSLIDVYDVSPFSGPSDTIYPYPNHILALTNMFIVNGSCPKVNPVYPDPSPQLPTATFLKNGTTASPGSQIHLGFSFNAATATHLPWFENKDYWAVFYHGVDKVSVPFSPKTNTTTIPAKFDPRAGVIIVVIADEYDAPTEESVVSLPLILLEQPSVLTLDFGV